MWAEPSAPPESFVENTTTKLILLKKYAAYGRAVGAAKNQVIHTSLVGDTTVDTIGCQWYDAHRFVSLDTHTIKFIMKGSKYEKDY
jgi:hypothetical protein